MNNPLNANYSKNSVIYNQNPQIKNEPIEDERAVNNIMEDSRYPDNNQRYTNNQVKTLRKIDIPDEILKEMVEKYRIYRSWKRVAKDYDDYNYGTILSRIKEFMGEEKYRKLLGVEPPKRFRSSRKLTNNNDFEIIINNLKRTVKTKGINLKMFFDQVKRFKATPSDLKKEVLRVAAILLQELIAQRDLPILKNRTYQTSLGKSYVQRGEDGFDYFRAYTHVIYEIQSLIEIGTDTDIYIGHTEKDIRNRFEYHVDISLKSYGKKGEFPSRLIEKAILLGISEEVSDLDHFFSEYQSLPLYKQINIREKLTNTLLDKYFTINILEKHYTKEKVSAREKWYKENYPDNDGTVNPHGLNMHSNLEHVGEYISLPLYDIAFMISIGYRGYEIAKFIRKLYGIKDLEVNIVYSRINQFFDSRENAEDIFLKPIIQSILERFPNMTGDQIGKLIHRKSGRQFFIKIGSPFNRWFGDFTLTEVKKAVVLEGFNWKNIDHFIEEIRKGNYIRGHHKTQWIELFIKGVSNEEMAEFGGYRSPEPFRHRFFNLKESRKAFNVSNRKEAVKKYRKLKTIETIRNNPSPSLLTLENLYTNVFEYQNREEYVKKYKDTTGGGNSHFEHSLKRYFERLFDGMLIQEIIEKFKH